MGLYSTTTTLATRMVQMDFDTATTALASEMIDDAEAEVNKYLSRRYDLSGATFQTSTSIPPTVRMLTSRLAEGYMWQANSRGAKESLARGKMLIDQVMGNLKEIADYKAELLSTAGSVVVDMSNTSYRVLCNTSTYQPTFDEGSEQEWQVDGDKITDIANTKD